MDSSILRFVSYNSSDNFIECPLDSKGMPFQCSLAPAEAPFIVRDFHEEPAGLDTEMLNGLDLGHCKVCGKILTYIMILELEQRNRNETKLYVQLEVRDSTPHPHHKRIPRGDLGGSPNG